LTRVIQIGTVRIEHPFVQAALSGYSDLPMRRIARMHGASYTINEVVLDRSVLHASAWRERLLAVAADDHPVGAQLMGADPEHFGPAARLLADAGYDVIDINFGCPVKKVLNRCRGGYLLSEPATALEIVRRVLDAVGRDRPVTLKMRRGIDDSDESVRQFFTILDGALELGIAAVTVHGRTVDQRYVGRSDWSFLARVKKHVGGAVILGSGDLFTAFDCVNMMHETGVDGVTVARGAIGNPWIFEACKAVSAGRSEPPRPTLEAQRDTLRAHFDEAIRCYGEEVAGKTMMKTGVKYARWHPNVRKVRAAFASVKSTADFRDVLRRWYENESADGSAG
jgi:nifR3 family TIM-barrel protein